VDFLKPTCASAFVRQYSPDHFGALFLTTTSIGNWVYIFSTPELRMYQPPPAGVSRCVLPECRAAPAGLPISKPILVPNLAPLCQIGGSGTIQSYGLAFVEQSDVT